MSRNQGLFRRVVDHLEGLTCGWEDYWYFHSLLKGVDSSGVTRCSAIENWGLYREYLLDLGVGRVGIETYIDDFALEQSDDSTVEGYWDPWLSSGLALSNWMAKSRRVYRLDSETQNVLLLTDLNDVQWRDVEFPFDSFCIELPHCLSHWRRTDYRWILFSKIKSDDPALLSDEVERLPMGSDWYTFVVIPDSCTRYRSIGRNAKHRLEKELDRNFLRGLKQVRNLIHNLNGTVGCEVTNLLQVAATHTVKETVTAGFDSMIANGNVEHQDFEAWRTFWTEVVRILFGLPLYLRSLPKASSHCSEPSAPGESSRKDPRAITSTAEVCTVTSSFRLTSSDRETLRQGVDGSSRWQWVEGYWRRPKGLGHDPTADRTEHVGPYLRGNSHRPERGLTGGAEKRL